MSEETKTLSLTPSTMRRLTIARYLYIQGLEQERKGDFLAGLALLPFHDAIELFLRTAAEIRSVSLPRNVEFMAYWQAFSGAGFPLPYREPIQRFNNARVEVKHRGTLPSRHDVEGFRSTITNFLIETSPKLFEIDFDSISLSSLIRSDEVRSELQAAEVAVNENMFREALELASKAFHRSLQHHRYGDPPITYHERLFDPTNVADRLDWQGREVGDIGHRNRLLEAVKNMGQSLGEAITILAYNLDYDGYRYIRTYGPVVMGMMGGSISIQWTREPTTEKAIVERCIEFAIDAALRLEARTSTQG